MGDGTTDAYVLNDGAVVSAGYLDQYAIKSAYNDDGSRQLPGDTFQDSYTTLGLVEPLYNIEALAQLPEINTYHERAVSTKANDVAGLGWSLEPLDEQASDPAQAQRDTAEAFLNSCNPLLDLGELLVQVVTDYETVGNGYIELIVDGAGRVSGMEHIPGHTMRVHADGKRLVQVRGGRRAWFKRAGLDDIDVDYLTGEIESAGGVPDERRATSVIHFKRYTSRSDYYGLPVIVPALGAIMGDRKQAEYNISFFDNNAIPAYAVTLTGANLSDDTRNTIKKFFQRDVKNNPHSTLVLSASSDIVGAPPIEMKFEKLATETKEASFQVYRESNRDEVLSAHGVPPYRAGIVVAGQMGGSSARETTEIYKQSVVRPGQSTIESRINKFVLQGLLGVDQWRLRLASIDTRDDAVDIANLSAMFTMGALTPNEVRAARGLDIVDNDPAMDRYYTPGAAVSQLPAAAPGADAMNAVKSLHERLVAVAEKG